MAKGMAITIALALPLAYAGGYFWLGERHDVGNPPSHTLRVYRHSWQVRLYQPAATIEATARRTKVYAVDYDTGVSWY